MPNAEIYGAGMSVSEFALHTQALMERLFDEDYSQVVLSRQTHFEAQLNVFYHRHKVLKLMINSKEVSLSHCEKLCDSKIKKLVQFLRGTEKNFWFSRSVFYTNEKLVETFSVLNSPAIGVIKGQHYA
ncbi:hypothetical protein [Pseudoalteromonas piratica]|uniref:Uncharacterized protein n=1 Tax=Pseudoalteromonas piratica TaxID=1348114 RepID=A0A0A7EM30_9GAMM|nr:hypothetical protein [Pseudoalteromonas piratica]AIY67593.1 hypothetical protein OM33_21610 [Pseudoalteromonas piratica]